MRELLTWRNLAAPLSAVSRNNFARSGEDIGGAWLAVAIMTSRKTTAKVAPAAAKRKAGKYWSGRVTRESNALDLEEGVFTWSDPKKIAASLKRSAELSSRRKARPDRSALSMLVFYINRAGKSLPAAQKRTLEQAKLELKKQFRRS